MKLVFASISICLHLLKASVFFNYIINKKGSPQRALLIKKYYVKKRKAISYPNISTSSHSHIITLSHYHIITLAHSHIRTSSHSHIQTFAHHYIITSSHTHTHTHTHTHVRALGNGSLR